MPIGQYGFLTRVARGQSQFTALGRQCPATVGLKHWHVECSHRGAPISPVSLKRSQASAYNHSPAAGANQIRPPGQYPKFWLTGRIRPSQIKIGRCDGEPIPALAVIRRVGPADIHDHYPPASASPYAAAVSFGRPSAPGTVFGGLELMRRVSGACLSNCPKAPQGTFRRPQREPSAGAVSFGPMGTGPNRPLCFPN
jgi:hypothetical protein